MRLYPTRPAVDLAIAGSLSVVAGVAAQQSASIGWGGALLLGLGVARGVTLLGVARVRSAGFEMLWADDVRLATLGRGEEICLNAEVRNRDSRATRFVHLRAVHSPGLDITIEPNNGEVPASGRLRVTVRVRALRVGHHGIHGLSLELRGGPDLFEIPLTFANAFGINVLPAAYAASLRSPRGGRSGLISPAGNFGRTRGPGSELRELREHQAGDPLKHIAWKASARRGMLLVRDHDVEERDVVWIALDASVEHWAGPAGEAPMDRAIDEAATLAVEHSRHGDRIGLVILGRRVLAELPPDAGKKHLMQLLADLSHRSSCFDHDRSALDDVAVARRVYEHMKPLFPSLAKGVSYRESGRLAARAAAAMERAPLPVIPIDGSNNHDQTLRRYLSAFGLESSPKPEPDREKTDLQMADWLRQLPRRRPAATILYIWSPSPTAQQRPEIHKALQKRQRRRLRLHWLPIHLGVDSPDLEPLPSAASLAVRWRSESAEARGQTELNQLGIQTHSPLKIRAPGHGPAPRRNAHQVQEDG